MHFWQVNASSQIFRTNIGVHAVTLPSHHELTCGLGCGGGSEGEVEGAAGGGVGGRSDCWAGSGGLELM